MSRKLRLEWVAVAAAAVASVATSAPPPDWSQDDSTPQRALQLSSENDASLRVYAEGPPGFFVGLDFESETRPLVEVTMTPDGADEPCATVTLGSENWSVEPIGDADRFHAAESVPSNCFSGEGPLLLVVDFTVLTRADAPEPAPETLYVKVNASAEGDEDEPQEPRVRVEFR